MEAYTSFAKVYDKFMKNVPYEKWADFIEIIIRECGISKPMREALDELEQERNLVLDLGCGTGTLTRMLYDKGYDMIGVDISQEMLDEAYSKNTDEKYNDIIYICQDMCELDLYSTIGTVISTCDSINYLLEDEEVIQCFKCVENYLYPGGLFIFDFNTIHKYRDVIGERTIAENDEECSFIWDNYYSVEDDINEYDLTLFIKEKDSDKYEKSVETHYQRGFSLEQIEVFLNKSGLCILSAIDECTIEKNCNDMIKQIKSGNSDCAKIDITDNSERIIVIAAKQ